ncbi:MAG: NUDIX hydrolase [Paracoccaceae bacterium]|nr:NUDIX hydrolase [Paracoccaceae bacterium]
MTESVPVRDAATIILVRDAGTSPAVLMGQRGHKAAFMPEKFVFPGGAVDTADAEVPLARGVDAVSEARLRAQAPTASPVALAAAAIRELWEETGLSLSRTGDWADRPAGWRDFAGGAGLPDASSLRFFFRAITPPGNPRRFDARFFLAPAEALSDAPDDLSDETSELSLLRWVPLAEARDLNLAFITTLVLAELSRHLPSLEAPKAVPFLQNDSMNTGVIWL